MSALERMHTLRRAAALTMTVAAVHACTAPTSGSREYRWALAHGACDCSPIAYPPRSAVASWVDGENLADYVKGKAMHCPSRQFVVVAFGDGDRDLAADLNLARARAAPVVRHFRDVSYRRLDTIALAGPATAHPSTVAILCPIDRLPEQNSF